jgi:hypothetical protein
VFAAGGRRIEGGRSRSRERLAVRGLVTPSGFVTALGLLVREAGTLAQREVADAD